MQCAVKRELPELFSEKEQASREVSRMEATSKAAGVGCAGSFCCAPRVGNRKQERTKAKQTECGVRGTVFASW
jgi:hypothetical protein